MYNVKTSGIIEDVNIGDFARELNDYRNSDEYICDAVSRIADNNTSIYYSDIINFISENVEDVNDTIKEFGWNGCGEDLYKAGQMAEYLKIEHEIYDELNGALLRMAHDYILYDLGSVIIPADLANAIKEWAADIDSNDRCNEICIRIDEWIHEHFETEVNDRV